MSDPFTEAARAEANKLTEHWSDERNRRRFLSIFTSGAEWARAHLTAQEPTDEEVYAARLATHGALSPTAARAALSAARAARRDEEKQDG